MRNAWHAVQPRFKELVALLEWKPTQAKEHAKLLEELRRVGLLGDELVFKLSIFNHAYDELRDRWAPRDMTPADAPVQEGRIRRWWKALGRIWKPALKAADVILGSLAKALPLSPAEAIKEYKEAGESGVEPGLTLEEAAYPDEPRPRKT